MLFLAACTAALAKGPPPVKAALEAGSPTATPGGAVLLWLKITVDPGWHIGAPDGKVPGGSPLEVTFWGPPGVQFDKVQYPPAKIEKIESLGGDQAVYDGTVVVRSAARIPGDAKPGSMTFNVTANYQACSDQVCLLPVDLTPSVEVTIRGTRDGLPIAAESGGGERAPSASPSPATSPTPGAAGPSPAESASPAAPPASPAFIGPPMPPTSPSPATIESAIAELPLVPVPTAGAPSPVAAGSPRALTPTPPTPAAETPVMAPAPAAGFTPIPDSAQSLDQRLASSFRENGLLLTLPLLFLCGLALNLTPCVYPMIAVTVSFFGGQGSGTLFWKLFLAVCYVLGMSVTYSTLGVAAALAGSLLGGVLSSTPVVLLLAAVFTALALSMFGLYDLQAPQFITNHFGAREGALGAFLMGLLVGFVAAPCIGPIVVMLVGIVAKEGSVFFGFITFFVLSLGLGAPYVVLATSAGMLTALPTSGTWMESVKRTFGVIMILMALCYLRAVLPVSAVNALAALVLMATGIGSGAMDAGGKAHELEGGAWWASILRRTTGLAALLVGGYLFVVTLHGFGLAGEAVPAAAPGGPAVTAAAGPAWETDATFLLQRQQVGVPVMIDFFSDIWCPACKELDHRTYPDPAVIHESRRFRAVKIDVDRHPKRKELMKRFGVIGIPTIIFLDSKGQENDALRVAGFIPPQDMLSRMRSVK